MNEKPAKKLTSKEAHTIGVIIRDRARVLRTHAEEQAAAYRLEAEDQINQLFDWAQADIWRKAIAAANEVIDGATELIARKCEALGIPTEYAPGLSVDLTNRGQALIDKRKAELRRAAKLKIDSMLKASLTQIDQEALDHRTKVVQNSALSPEAQAFIETFKPIDETMKQLSISDIEKAVEDQKRAGRDRFAGLIYREPLE